MNIIEFNKWNLHDASIESVVVDWSNQSCSIDLYIFPDTAKNAVPCKIIWSNVTEVNIPMKLPWGSSIFVNSSRTIGNNKFIIEMQSGDEINITAGRVELIESQTN